MRLVFTAWAEDDIRLIFVYGLKTRGRTAADRYLRRLHDTFRRLLALPEMGRRDDAISPGLRSIVAREHRAFYRIDGDTVRIVRVLHQRASSADLDGIAHLVRSIPTSG